MVGARGFEPLSPCGHQGLSLDRIPVPTRPRALRYVCCEQKETILLRILQREARRISNRPSADPASASSRDQKETEPSPPWRVSSRDKGHSTRNTSRRSAGWIAPSDSEAARSDYDRRCA